MRFIYYCIHFGIIISLSIMLSSCLQSTGHFGNDEIIKESTEPYKYENDKEEVILLNDVDNNTLIPVLMYHHFVEDENKTSYTTVSKAAFSEQMTYLRSKGYQTITDEDIVNYYYNGKELPEKPIHITIDDGYASNYEIAYPILKEHNMKATIYIIVSRIDTIHSLTRLTWEQLKEMVDSGIINIQSHTYDLHHKEDVNDSEVSAMIAYDDEAYFNRIVSDLKLSKDIIEHELEQEVVSLAYPYGHYNEDTLLAVKKANYKIAYTVEHGLNNARTNPLELKRINVVPGWTGETIDKEIKKQKKGEID